MNRSELNGILWKINDLNVNKKHIVSIRIDGDNDDRPLGIVSFRKVGHNCYQVKTRLSDNVETLNTNGDINVVRLAMLRVLGDYEPVVLTDYRLLTGLHCYATHDTCIGVIQLNSN